MHRNLAVVVVVLTTALGPATFAQPANDDCSDAISVHTDERYTGSTLGATGSDVSTCGRNDTLDVWHTWRSSCSGLATFSLCDSGFDTVLAVYDGCDGVQLACNNDAPDGCHQEDRSLVRAFPVTRRTRYWIRVAGAGGTTGDYRLLVTCTELGYGACCLPDGSCGQMSGEECASQGGRFLVDESCDGLDCSAPQPPHDLCESAIPVFTDEPLIGSTFNATGHGVTACDEDARDVWHVWTCDCERFAEVSLCGSSFDTILSVYDACGGAELGCSDDSPTCRLETSSRIRRLAVTTGGEYRVRVAGHNGETGDYQLTVRCVRERRGTGAGERRRPQSVQKAP